MTLDEAIQHCKEQVQEQAKKGCYSCAEEHQQLAEWLKELKVYKEKETCETCGHYKAYQHGADITTMDDECGGCCSWNSRWVPNTCGDAISRQAVIELFEGWWLGHTKEDDFVTEVRVLPSVTPQQRTGRWIKEGQGGRYKWMCSNCGTHHRALYDYCPSCGTRMPESEVQDAD